MAKKNSKQPNKNKSKSRVKIDKLIEQKKRKYLKNLAKFRVVGAAMQVAKIKGRATLTEWRQDDKEFKKAEESIKYENEDDINDLAERKLISAISKEKGWAVRFRLQTHHPAYVPKQEIDLSGREKIDESLDKLGKVLSENGKKKNRKNNK